MEVRVVGNVSSLPETRFGHHAPQWWGVTGMIAIEGTIFALCIATYFYLRLQTPTWPPQGIGLPSLQAGTLNTALIVIGILPLVLIERHAMRGDRAHVLLYLCIFVALSLVTLVVRGYEFRGLQVKWDTNAYGSIVWITLFFHSLHLLTTFLEKAVLLVYIGLRGMDEKRILDLQLNTLYWYFIVASWVVLYGVIYFGPYMLN